MDAPIHMLQRFFYTLYGSNGYIFSTFSQWHEEVLVLNPLNINKVTELNQGASVFPKEMYNSLNSNLVPVNPYEKLLWKFVHHNSLSLEDVELNTGDVLFSGSTHRDVWLYTPIIIFIIRKILSLP